MKKLFLLCAIVLVSFSTSCVSESCLDNPDNDTRNYEEIAISLRIVQQPETRGVSRPICDGELLEFNTGDLYLVTATGTIMRHYAIVAANPAITELTDANRTARIIHRNLLGDGRGSGGVTLTAVPSSVTRIIIVGNTLGNATNGNVNAVGARVLDIISQYNAWNVNLFGEDPAIYKLATPTPTYTHTAHVKLNPTVARIEIGSIMGTRDCIYSFSLEGIFIDNYFRNARIDGTLLTEWRSKGSNPATFVSGSTAYPVALSPALFDWYPGGRPADANLTVTPGGSSTFPCTSLLCSETSHTRDNVWSYQLFAQTNTTPPRIIVRLRDVVLVGNNGNNIPLEGAQFLTVPLSELYNFDNGISAAGVYRIPQIVFDRNDLDIPNPTDPIPSADSHITAFTRVMYDFQRQTLESWVTWGSAAPIAWQWQVATSNIADAFVNIPNATTANWTIPQDFIHNPIYNGIDVLYFRVVMTLSDGSQITQQTADSTLQIRFIRTTVQGEGTGFRRGFGICPEGVRYAVMNRAQHLGEGSNTIRVALLNVGAGDHDGGLGSFFQWGRRADGHEQTVWGRGNWIPGGSWSTGGNNANHLVTGTSGVVERTGITLDPITGQPTSAAHQGRFITNSTVWSSTAHRSMWGNGSNMNDRAGSPVSLADWSINELPNNINNNNPCPPGWHVPTTWDWDDMNRGTGFNTTTNPSGYSGNFPTNNNLNWNHWQNFIPVRASAIGGTIIRNTTSSAAIFLPAGGMRYTNSNRTTANLFHHGEQGHYWTSTIDANSTHRAMALWFNSNSVQVSRNHYHKSIALFVRCVAD